MPTIYMFGIFVEVTCMSGRARTILPESTATFPKIWQTEGLRGVVLSVAALDAASATGAGATAAVATVDAVAVAIVAVERVAGVAATRRSGSRE